VGVRSRRVRRAGGRALPEHRRAARPTREEVTPDGHLVRYDEDGDLSGITFVNAKWLLERDGKLGVEVHAHVAARRSDLALAFA
jgi:uncharacterized protein YuzE